MDLLKQIQDAVLDRNSDLPTILRYCRVLAARLAHDDLKAWVTKELDGYDGCDPVPDYRRTSVESRGYFSGPMGYVLDNAPIPLSIVPEKFRDNIEHAYFRESVSALESLAKGKSLKSSWPPELIAMVGEDVYQYLSMIDAWRVIPNSVISGILDTVRNRVLNFAIELESSKVMDSQVEGLADEGSSTKIQNIFHTTILGDVNNLAVGTAEIKQVSVHVKRADLESLRSFLCQFGFDEGDLTSLEEALKEDDQPKSGSKLGPKVSNWIGKAVAKAGQGLLQLSISTAGNVLGKAINSYYGI